MSTKDSETGEFFYPVQSMTLNENSIINNNEWIDKEFQNDSNHRPSPYFESAQINKDEKVRFISPILENNNAQDRGEAEIGRSILNELLPTQVQFESNESNFSSREKFMQYFENDAFFGQLFKAMLISWLIFSVYVILKTDGNGLASDKLPVTIGWFICLLGFGLGLSAVWAKILAEQTEFVVYGLVFGLPAGFAFLAMTAISHWFIASGLILAGISVFLFGAIWLNRQNYQTTVEIVRTSAIFIQATPKVYTLLFKTAFAYTAFVIIWLMEFSRLFGALSSVPFTISAVLHIFLLLWVGGVLVTLQKFIIAKWVRSWMKRVDDDFASQEDESLGILDQYSFGSICLAAGIISVAKCIRLVSKSIHFTLRSTERIIPTSGLFADFCGWLVSLMSAAERILQRFTDFSIYYMAVGEVKGFMNASRGLNQAISGHWALAVTTDSTSQLILTFSTTLIALASTALVLTVAKTYISWSSSILIGLLAVSVTDFVSTTFTSAIDASFLCYLLDLKDPNRAGKLNPKLQSAFSSKLEDDSTV
jgi:hypothetical protein